MKVARDEKAGTLTIVLDTNEKSVVSKSGKSLIVATTHGNIPTTVQVNGQPLIVSVNAYIKNPTPAPAAPA